MDADLGDADCIRACPVVRRGLSIVTNLLQKLVARIEQLDLKRNDAKTAAVVPGVGDVHPCDASGSCQRDLKPCIGLLIRMEDRAACTVERTPVTIDGRSSAVLVPIYIGSK